ncbi:MAG: hypothetical protein P8O03_12725, partial [Ilumatobacter sp.]|nr:hypothetical protein [Ilumatobacter sp.]
MRTNTQTTLYRHPSDVARLVFWLVVLGFLLLLSLLQENALANISSDVLALVDGLPNAMVNGLVGLVQMLATLMPFVAVFVLLRSRYWQLSLLMVLASVIAAGAMSILTGVIEESVPLDRLGYGQVESWFIGSQYPSATYLAMLIAWLVAAGPWMTQSWRRTGWVFIVFVMSARILSSTEVPVRNLMMVAVGAAAGSLALVIFGAPRRTVNIESVRAALSRAGLEIDDIRSQAHRRRTPTFIATATSGGHWFVKVLGRDQRDSDVLLRVWRSLTVKGVGGGVPASPRRAVDHEAL